MVILTSCEAVKFSLVFKWIFDQSYWNVAVITLSPWCVRLFGLITRRKRGGTANCTPECGSIFTYISKILVHIRQTRLLHVFHCLHYGFSKCIITDLIIITSTVYSTYSTDRCIEYTEVFWVRLESIIFFCTSHASLLCLMSLFDYFRSTHNC